MTSLRLPCLVLAALVAAPPGVSAQVAGPVTPMAMPWGGGDKAAPAAPAAATFGVGVALFVMERAEGYGMYQARAGNHFKAGETLRFYLEPVGYQYKAVGNLYSFGATIDLRLTQTGNTVFSKDGFLNANFLSHHQNKEVNFTGSLDVSTAPAGEYNLELVVQDKFGPGVAKVVLPFVID